MPTSAGGAGRGPESPYQRATRLLREVRGDEAVAVMERAVAQQPDSVEVVGRLALVCWEADRIDDAAGHADAALVRDPENASALAARGLVAHTRHRPRDAVRDLEHAARLRPDFVAAHVYAGNAYGALGDDDRALTSLDRALLLQPQHPHARFSRALNWLRRGWFDRGWPEYEWRWATGQLTRPEIPRPRWDGSALAGRRILVHSEQGIGDTFQLARLLPALQAEGARVTFACMSTLRTLLERTPGIDDWFPIDEPAPADFDLFTPIGTLPALLGIDERTIPRSVPYVHPDPDRVERWRPRLAGLRGLRVGIAWQGSPTFRGDHYRSIPLRHYAPLAAVPGVSLVSLQKGAGEEQIGTVGTAVPLTVLDGLDADGATMADTAAVMAHLDLVITSDTTIAHLAGSMGVPVWVALTIGSDWRWLRERTDSPWYPSMRLFRQTELLDWDEVFAAMAAALHDRVAQAGPPAPGPTVPPPPVRVAHVAVAAGELFDKISILRIKSVRITDPVKLDRVRRELAALEPAAAGYPPTDALPRPGRRAPRGQRDPLGHRGRDPRVRTQP